MLYQLADIVEQHLHFHTLDMSPLNYHILIYEVLQHHIPNIYKHKQPCGDRGSRTPD